MAWKGGGDQEMLDPLPPLLVGSSLRKKSNLCSRPF